jgi:hypothetical protein
MILSVFAKTDGTYNSFIRQIGFCKMQSFSTISRSTSVSVPMFLDNRIQFGVGISDYNMQESEGHLCGMCLNVTHIDNFYEWDYELTQWTNNKWKSDKSFLAMVFDRCPDQICVPDFLDFDIYNPKQPVFRDNPKNISWHYVPCPIKNNEYIEYLICTSYSCKELDEQNQTLSEILNKPHYYWTITFRNMRIPIKKVIIHYNEQDYILKKENSWTWDGYLYNLNYGINMTFIDLENKIFNDFLNITNGNINPHYNGGIFLQSNLQN